MVWVGWALVFGGLFGFGCIVYRLCLMLAGWVGYLMPVLFGLL